MEQLEHLDALSIQRRCQSRMALTMGATLTQKRLRSPQGHDRLVRALLGQPGVDINKLDSIHVDVRMLH